MMKRQEKFEEEQLTNQEKTLDDMPGNENNPLDSILKKEESEQLESLLKKLYPREKKAIELRYGIGEDKKIHTLEEVGEILGGIGKDRVKEIERRALRRLGLVKTEGEVVNLKDLLKRAKN